MPTSNIQNSNFNNNIDDDDDDDNYNFLRRITS